MVMHRQLWTSWPARLWTTGSAGKSWGEKRERGGGSISWGPLPIANPNHHANPIALSNHSSLKHPPISPSPMPRQGLKSGLQGLVSLSLWDDKDNALKRRIGPQSKIVEMPIGIDDFQEASRDVATACRQQDGAFSITELALEVLNRWSCLADHQHISQKVIHRLSPKKLSNPKTPATP